MKSSLGVFILVLVGRMVRDLRTVKNLSETSHCAMSAHIVSLNLFCMVFSCLYLVVPNAGSHTVLGMLES